MLCAALVLTLVMALLPHPPELPVTSDKLQHAAAFVTLALLAAVGYPSVAPLRLLTPLSAFGALIELLQAIPALHRDCDPLDWLTDTLAAAAALVLIYWWRRQRDKATAAREFSLDQKD